MRVLREALFSRGEGRLLLGIARTCAFFVVVVIVAVVDGADKKTRTKTNNARGTDVTAMASVGAALGARAQRLQPSAVAPPEPRGRCTGA